ncbi:MAG: peptidase S8 [Deltaproteobacteria bacterium]|nr:MAG: peptidase S8 [Deltaproteobacteria bacterium]
MGHANKRVVRALAVTALGALVLSATAAHAGGPSDPGKASWTTESSWDIPGEYVVDFHDDIESSTIRTLLTSLGVTFRASVLEPATRIEIVSISGAVSTVLTKLRGDTRIEHIEPHARVAALFVPDDPMFDKQWHLSRVGAEAAWGLTIGRGVTVAVIDTGIACETFDQFKKATDLANTRCVEGRSFVDSSKHANDDHGHGTHVAGTIAQSTNNGLGTAGLAFGARLMPVKVLSGDGWGTTTGVADGIRWAADNGAQVINLSLGSPRNSQVLQAAIDHARAQGVVIVAAAGNSAGAVGYPGGSRGVIGVSATDSDDQLAWFSSRGKGVDIAAPGVNVLQQTICDRGLNGCEIFGEFNGTSMASPHVAAAAALLVGLGVTDADAVERYLTDTAKVVDESDAGRDKYGAGLLQAADAASRVVLTQTLTRLIALALLAWLAFRWARKRGKTISGASPSFWLAALTAGVGLLFFAPWVLSRHQLWVDLLSRPFGEWDLLIGVSLHSFLPLANMILPLVLILALLRVRGAAPWLAGFSVGTAAYLTSVALLGQLATPFGWWITTLWCAVNAAVCLWLASLLIAKRS